MPLSSDSPPPPRDRAEKLLEGAVVGILLFLAVTSVVSRALLIFAQ